MAALAVDGEGAVEHTVRREPHHAAQTFRQRRADLVEPDRQSAVLPGHLARPDDEAVLGAPGAATPPLGHRPTAAGSVERDVERAVVLGVGDARPAARQLSESTLPTAEATLKDLRETSRALRAVTEKIESQGAGGLIGGQKLPDYKPK